MDSSAALRRRAYVARAHATKKEKRDLGATVVKLKDRYSGSHVSKTRTRRQHATILAAAPTANGIEVGDIVQRSDSDSKNRYVVTEIRPPWIFTHRNSGRGGPGIITFPSSRMLRKVG